MRQSARCFATALATAAAAGAAATVAKTALAKGTPEAKGTAAKGDAEAAAAGDEDDTSRLEPSLPSQSYGGCLHASEGMQKCCCCLYA